MVKATRDVFEEGKAPQGWDLAEPDFLRVLNRRFLEGVMGHWERIPLTEGQWFKGMPRFSVKGESPDPTPEELAVIQKTPARILLWNAANLMHQFRGFLRDARPWIPNRMTIAFQAGADKNRTMRNLRRVSDYLINPTFSLLLPGLWQRPWSRVDRILRRQAFDPDYEPTAEEWESLTLLKRDKAFLERRAFLTDHPRWAAFRWGTGKLSKAAFIALYGLLGNHLHYLLNENNIVSAEDYLLDSEDSKLEEDEIQIWESLVPHPHSAIRVGNKIYTYGQTHLRAYSTQEYLKMFLLRTEVAKLKAEASNLGIPLETLKENARKRGIPPAMLDDKHDEEETDPESINSASVVGNVYTLLGLDTLPPSMNVVTIKVGKETAHEIKRELELQVGKRYQNITYMNDCSTMALRKAGFHNRLYDASPGLSTMILAAMKTEGDPRIGRIFQVAVGYDPHSKTHLARNLELNLLESSLYLKSFLMNQTGRAIIDIDVAKNGDKALEWYDPQIQEMIDGWKFSARESFVKDRTFILLGMQAARTGKASTDAEKKIFLEKVNAYFLKKETENKDILDPQKSPYVHKKDVAYATYWLEMQSELKAELLRKAGISP